MAVVKNKTNDANREYWSHIEEVASEVDKWPNWLANRQGESKAGEKSEPIRVRAANAGGQGCNDK
jgi:hypothetical protein